MDRSMMRRRRLGVAEVVTDGVDGFRADLGRFFCGHAGEKAHFDECHQAWIFALQLFHGLIEV